MKCISIYQKCENLANLQKNKVESMLKEWGSILKTCRMFRMSQISKICKNIEYLCTYIKKVKNIAEHVNVEKLENSQEKCGKIYKSF